VSVDVEAALAAFVPALIWLAVVYSKDKYEREPKVLIAWLFVASIVAVVVAVLIEQGVRPDLSASARGIVIVSALGVGLIEEGSKFGLTFLLTRRSRNLNEPVDGMIYASTVALGFAAIETTMYIIRIYHRVELLGFSPQVAFHVAFHQVAPVRAFTGALGHMSWAGIVGYAYGNHVAGTGSRRDIGTMLLLAAVLHAAYDGLLALGAPTLAYAVLGVSIVLYIRRFRHALAISPFRTRQLRPRPPTPPQHAFAYPPHPGSTVTVVPVAPPRPDAWHATHVVPEGGLHAWSRPDVTSAVMGTLAPGTEVQATEHAGDWAHVLTSHGWAGWVDGRPLIPRQPTSRA
jgi:protease PrsW